MANEESGEVLDDLRKKRLAYFQTQSESIGNQSSSTLQQSALSSGNKLEVLQQHSLQSSSSQPYVSKQIPQSNLIEARPAVPHTSTSKHDVEKPFNTSAISGSHQSENKRRPSDTPASTSKHDVELPCNTTAFSPSSHQTENSVNKLQNETQSESITRNMTTASSIKRPFNDNRVENMVDDIEPDSRLGKNSPMSSDQDGYNETVERLIRATKEELLGKTASDNIWQRIRKTSETDFSIKTNENENHSSGSSKLADNDHKSHEFNQKGEEYIHGENNNKALHTKFNLVPSKMSQYKHIEIEQPSTEKKTFHPVSDNKMWKEHYHDSEAVPAKVTGDLEPSFTKHEVNKYEVNRQSYDSATVEAIFSSRQNPWSQIPSTHLDLQESQDLEVISEKKVEESLDMTELGLSTHRPDMDTDSNRESVLASDLNIRDSITLELRTVLGEDKFQEFLNKAKRDIDDLHETRSDRSGRKDKTPRMYKENTTNVNAAVGQKQTAIGTPTKTFSAKGDRKTKIFQRQSSEPPRQSKGGSEPVRNLPTRQISSIEVRDKQVNLASRSTDFTPRVSDGEAVANIIGEYVLDSIGSKGSTSPSLKPDVAVESLVGSGSESSRIVPELNLSDINKSDSPRLTKLNRPKHEPFNIYQDKAKVQEGKTKSGGESSRLDTKVGYEQKPVLKNVVFSADEIYSQAYGNLYHSHPEFQMMSPHLANSLNGSLQYSVQSPGPSSVTGPAFTIPLTPTTPVYTTTHVTPSLKQGMVHGSQMNPVSQAEEMAKFQQYAQHVATQPTHPFEQMQLPHPPNQLLQQPSHIHTSQVHGYGSMYDYAQEYRGYPVNMGDQFATNPPISGPPGLMPHPPKMSENPRQANLNISSSFQPPPETPIGFSSYPYHPMMGQHLPHRETYKIEHGEPTQLSIVVAPTSAVSDTHKSTEMDKVTLVEESAFTSVSQIQIPESEVMVPHPPPTKKGNRSTPRKPVKVQDTNRHIDGIRQHHEQRRQEQEESILTDEEILARQRKFAKASIDRYFVSLENLYINPKAVKPDTVNENYDTYNQNSEDGDERNERNEFVGENHNSQVHDVCEENEIPVDITPNKYTQVQQHTAEAYKGATSIHTFDVGKSLDEETIVNSEVTGITVNAGGVTDRLEGIGIHVSHGTAENDQLHKNVDETGLKKQSKQGKRLLICPECQGLNKEYMSWCTHCGEMIIGVEPKLVSKTRDGKLRIKPVVEGTELTISEMNNINSNEQSVEVNYVQEIADKPFSLNLDKLKSEEREHLIDPKNTSPIKSDGKDSGRPSSDDRDHDLQGQTTEHDVVDITRETVPDPIVPGYVRSHLTKEQKKLQDAQKDDLNHSEKLNMKNNDKNEKKHVINSENTADRRDKLNSKNVKTYMLKNNSHDVVTDFAQGTANIYSPLLDEGNIDKMSVADRVKAIESDSEAKLKKDTIYASSAQFKNTPILKGDLAMDSIGATYLIMSKRHDLLETGVDKETDGKSLIGRTDKERHTSVFELTVDKSDELERTDPRGLPVLSNKIIQSFNRENAITHNRGSSLSNKEILECNVRETDIQLHKEMKGLPSEKSVISKDMDHNENVVPPLLPNFSMHAPVSQSELALKLPLNSMDFSMDYSQTASMTYEALDEFKTEEELKAIKEAKKKERRRKRGHGAIDVEVFGIEEMRESRNSSRGQKLVPILNLAGNSSDEDDDFSTQSDTKSDSKAEMYEELANLAPLNPKVSSSINAWQSETIPEIPLFEMYTTPDLPVSSSPDNSARPLSDVLSPAVVPDLAARSNLMSESNEDWKNLFDPKHTNEFEEVHEDHDETESMDLNQPFLEHIIKQDPQPVKSKKRPKSAKSKPVKSKVRQSMEETSFQRKWGTSSSVYSSYNAGELNTSSSLRSSAEFRRPSSAPKARNHSSMVSKGQDGRTRDTSPAKQPVGRPKRPFSADINKRLSSSTSDLSKALQPSPSPSVNQRGRDVSPYRSSSGTNQDHSNNVSRNENSQDVSADRMDPAYEPSSSFIESGHQGNMTGLLHQLSVAVDHRQSAQEPRPSVTKGTSPLRLNLGNDKRPPSASKSKGKNLKQKKKSGNPSNDLDLSVDLVTVEHRLPKPGVLEWLSDLISATSPKSTYDKYLEMTPRIEAGTISKWQCLPDEILLHVFAYLDQTSLTTCAQVCHQFYRVAMDESLWKYITIKKHNDLDDLCLMEISKRHPVSLALIQCQGEQVTSKGLRDLFRECSSTLKELNISMCSKGALHGDSLLLHAAARCNHLTHIDTSWCSVTDSGLMAISNTVDRLESLCINGCQAISDDGLETIIKKHGSNLRVLEMFGCFNLSPRGLRCISNNCINLLSINLGNCYKLTDSCIAQLSVSLGRVESLDLRGCKQIKDNSIRRVVKNCPRLKTLSLANCLNITDVSLLEISTYLTDIRSIDLCGCKKVTDNSVRALVNTCTNLREIDISSTGCTHRSVSMIANFSGQRLETLKINFLSDVTEQSLIKLAKHCKRLKSVHMYGCPSVRNMSNIQEERPTFTINM